MVWYFYQLPAIPRHPPPSVLLPWSDLWTRGYSEYEVLLQNKCHEQAALSCRYYRGFLQPYDDIKEVAFTWLGPESLSQKSNIQKNLRTSQLEAYLKRHATRGGGEWSCQQCFEYIGAETLPHNLSGMANGNLPSHPNTSLLHMKARGVPV